MAIGFRPLAVLVPILFAALASGAPAPKVARARRGPIELTLKVLDRPVHVSGADVAPSADSIFCRLELKNKGDRPLFISDRPLLVPGSLATASTAWGLYLVVRKIGGPTPQFKSEDAAIVPGTAGWKESEDRARRVRELEAHGYSPEEAQARASSDSTRLDPPPGRWLKPGETALSPTSGIVPGYEEVSLYDFSEPGEYAVYAVYDHTPRGRKKGQPSPAAIKVATPEIHFKVAR